ncbi:p21-activated protein kinase-interacting protein 1-like [Limanda limanda]|uniref:p21-activated protein kinase-interacting protein 1-like n=1 Tax=Limanda limanda TaxID=27771 RepID=UPI0029C66008|nr:p21-activated protein kinase-interacting protein 1-like [Limanda limanda]
MTKTASDRKQRLRACSDPCWTRRRGNKTAHIVRWSPDGDKYVVVVDDEVNIYDLETASVKGTITISSVKFLNNSLLAVAGDDEIVRLCELEKLKCVCEFKAHETRVKAVDSFMMEDYCVLVTASNDGLIKMWKLLNLKEARLCCCL